MVGSLFFALLFQNCLAGFVFHALGSYPKGKYATFYKLL